MLFSIWITTLPPISDIINIQKLSYYMCRGHKHPKDCSLHCSH